LQKLKKKVAQIASINNLDGELQKVKDSVNEIVKLSPQLFQMKLEFSYEVHE